MEIMTMNKSPCICDMFNCDFVLFCAMKYYFTAILQEQLYHLLHDGLTAVLR